jgi:hypothetical protein
VVTGGRPTPQLRVSINNKSAGFAVPDTGASWTVVPQSIAQQHRLRVDQSIKVSLRAANGQLMPVVGRTTFLLSALGLAKSTSAKVQALVCPGVSKIYVGWEALVALGVIPAAFPEPLCADPPSALDANSHQEPKRTPKSASGVVRKQTSPTPAPMTAIHRVQSVQRRLRSGQRLASVAKRPRLVNVSPPATDQVRWIPAGRPPRQLQAAARKRSILKLQTLYQKYKDVFNEDVKPMEGPEMTIKLKE